MVTARRGGTRPAELATAPLDSPARLGELVEQLENRLSRLAPADRRREARDIVAMLLDESRYWVAANTDLAATPELVRAADAAALRRAGGAPLAYAVGRAAFRHLVLSVDERVLIPRPETEGLVEIVLRSCQPGGIVVDVGSGSGAIALALASEGRFDRVIGIEISADAVEVARSNAERLASALRAPVEFRLGSFLAPLDGIRARAVVSNPPYISYAELQDLPADVRDWEPVVALSSGSDGLAATAAIVNQAAPVLEDGGLLALEVDARRAASVAALVSADGRYSNVVVGLDLAGRERYVTARRS
jgi:release factor glutamine methyltransferase